MLSTSPRGRLLSLHTARKGCIEDIYSRRYLLILSLDLCQSLKKKQSQEGESKERCGSEVVSILFPL